MTPINGYDDLIQLLTILRKYSNDNLYAPTHCEHDVMMFMGVTREQISDDDWEVLDDLGVFDSEEYECLASFRFGSA